MNLFLSNNLLNNFSNSFVNNFFILNNLSNKNIVFSGFKDNDLHNTLIKYNNNMQQTINCNSDLLIVEDADKPYASAKVKLAYKYKIPIIERWQIIKIINNQ